MEKPDGMSRIEDHGIDRVRLTRLRAEEDKRFEERSRRSAALLERARASQPLGVPMSWFASMYQHVPPFVASGSGAWFEDVDGNHYLDMNLVDLAGTLGFANPIVTAAVKTAAERGLAFLLPTEDGIAATERLAATTAFPYWQFAGAASGANTELIRIARVATGRTKVLKFDGAYHGHIDDTLVIREDGELRPEGLGLPAGAAKDVKIVPFNDLEALERALAPGDVACVLSEPVLTNSNLVFPDPGFWEAARGLTRAAGTLLYMDEAHSYSFAFGGVTRAHAIEADGQVMGKGLGSGVPFAVYGVSAELAELLVRNLDRDDSLRRGIALGGTTYANVMALAVARAVLEKLLTEEGYARNAGLGSRLGDGLEAIFARRGLDWRAPRIGGRSGWILSPELPRTAQEAGPSLDPLFVETRRVFMANRGVWEAISSAGPAASFMHEEADIDRYLSVADDYLEAVT